MFMQLNRNSTILIGVGLLLAAVLVVLLAPSEERRVRKTFDRAAELLGKEPDEPMLTTAAKANGLSSLIAPSLDFEAKELGVKHKFDPASVAQYATMMRAHERHIAVVFSDLTVEFPAETENLAEVLGNVKVDADHNLGFKDKESRTFEATLKKDAETDTWQFSKVNVHRVN